MAYPRSEYSFGEKIFISLAPRGGGIIAIIVNASFLKFYTDFIGLSPAIYGVVFLIFSIWNAINDPIIGIWSDQRPFVPGKGKYVPLLRWSVPIIAISTFLMVIASPNWSQTFTAAYLLVGLLVWEAGQALFGVSFRAFSVNAFLAMDERTEFQVIQQYTGLIPTFLGGLIPAWLLTGEFELRTIVMVFTFAIILGSALTLVSVRFMRERAAFYEHLEVTKGLGELWSLARSLLRDRAFITFLLAFFVIFGVAGSYFGPYLYYMDNVLLVSGIWSVLPDVGTGIVQIIVYPFLIGLVARFSGRNTLSVMLGFAVVGHLMLTFPLGLLGHLCRLRDHVSGLRHVVRDTGAVGGDPGGSR